MEFSLYPLNTERQAGKLNTNILSIWFDQAGIEPRF